jgi:hypothetical protein
MMSGGILKVAFGEVTQSRSWNRGPGGRCSSAPRRPAWSSPRLRLLRKPLPASALLTTRGARLDPDQHPKKRPFSGARKCRWLAASRSHPGPSTGPWSCTAGRDQDREQGLAAHGEHEMLATNDEQVGGPVAQARG